VAPALKAAADVLRSGGSLLIFPEGTRSPDGTLGPLKSGAAYLAWHLGRPDNPVAITGARAVQPRGRWLPAFFGGAKVDHALGEPLERAPFPRSRRSTRPSAWPCFREAMGRATQKGVDKGKRPSHYLTPKNGGKSMFQIRWAKQGLILFTVFLFLSVLAIDAWARVGGGRSFGSRGSRTYTMPRSTPAPHHEPLSSKPAVRHPGPAPPSPFGAAGSCAAWPAGSWAA
jgi:hypothetical protein